MVSINFLTSVRPQVIMVQNQQGTWFCTMNIQNYLVTFLLDNEDVV